MAETFIRSNAFKSLVALVVCVCVAVVVIAAQGKHLTQPLLPAWFDPSQIEIRVQDADGNPLEGVVRATLVESAAGLSVDLEALSPGYSLVVCRHNRDDITSLIIEAYVSPLGVVYTNGTTRGGWAAPLAAVAWFWYVALLAGRSFQKRFRDDLFSYRTVFDLGVCLACTVLGAVEALVLGLSLNSGVAMGPLSAVDAFGSNAQLIFTLTFPLLAVPLVGLAASNVSLIRHEGPRPQNMLGIALALVFMAGILFVAVFPFTSGSKLEMLTWDAFASIASCLLCYLECMLAAVTVCAVAASRRKPDPDRDYTIVLGCAIRKDGTPTPLLRGRCDGALDLWRQEARQGKRMSIVCSGGQGADEVCSEAESMAGYLLDQGVAPEDVLLEGRSTSTLENMGFSRQVIEGHAGKPIDQVKVAFSTTNYHVFRAGIYAARQGIKAQGISCPTKWYFWPNAFLRESVGLFVAKLRSHAAFALFFIVVNVIAEALHGIIF